MNLVRIFFTTLAIIILNYVNSLEPVFKTCSTLSELLSAKRDFLRRGKCGEYHTEPNLGLKTSLHDAEDDTRFAQQISRLAFGGRGAGLLHKSKKRKVAHVDFDKTMGFPGEGWSNKHLNFKIGTWNTRSMTRERFDYCKLLSYDVLTVTELWRTQKKFQTRRKTFIVGEAKINKRTGKPRFPNDKAAGVGIILSPAAEQKVLTFGSTSERVCYVRLAGPVCNLFIVATYMPHRGRVSPDQDDTIKDIHEALQKAPTQDCIILLGDLNEQLGVNIKNRTGRWAGGESSKNADKIIEVMHMYDLYAVNTHFEPKKGDSVNSFVCPARKDEQNGDLGLHVGSVVSAKYCGNTVQGEVIGLEHQAPAYS